MNYMAYSDTNMLSQMDRRPIYYGNRAKIVQHFWRNVCVPTDKIIRDYMRFGVAKAILEMAGFAEAMRIIREPCVIRLAKNFMGRLIFKSQAYLKRSTSEEDRAFNTVVNQAYALLGTITITPGRINARDTLVATLAAALPISVAGASIADPITQQFLDAAGQLVECIENIQEEFHRNQRLIYTQNLRNLSYMIPNYQYAFLRWSKKHLAPDHDTQCRFYSYYYMAQTHPELRAEVERYGDVETRLALMERIIVEDQGQQVFNNLVASLAATRL